MPDWSQRTSQWLDCTRVLGHCDGVLAAADRGAPLSSSSSISSSSAFPSGFNWKCIYCRARGWSGEKEAAQLLKMWLRWGLQGLAPLQHHQLAHTVSFSSLYVFWWLPCVLLPHTEFCFLTLLCLLVFSLRSRLSFLASCLFYSLSLFFVLDWTCIWFYSNANGASQFNGSYEV